MKLVFLVGSYYPNYSAVSKCVSNIIEELSDKFEIIIISDMDNKKFASSEKYKKENIYRIRTINMRKRDETEKREQMSNNKFLKKLYWASKNYLRVIDYFKILFSKVSVDQNLVDEYLNVLNNIDDIYAIIPTCYPFESVIAALNYNKNNKTKIFPILFDKFSESPTLHKFKLNKVIKKTRHSNLEKEMIYKSNAVFYTEAWENIMANYNNLDVKNKVIQIGHPLIKNKSTVPDKYLSLETPVNKFIYTGVLDNKVRSPKNVLIFLEFLTQKNKNNLISIYSTGNSIKQVNKFANRNKNIINCGYVDSKAALEKQKESDFLISIGNSDITLIPSKIYEYLSLGKPIIHFYKDNNDPVINILSNYSNSISFPEKDIVNGNIEQLYNRFCCFVESNKGIQINFEDIKKEFNNCTPFFVTKTIESELINGG